MKSIRFLYSQSDLPTRHDSDAVMQCAAGTVKVAFAELDPDGDVDKALGSDEPDFVVLSCMQSIAQVREAIEQRGWRTRLIVYWMRTWPKGFEHIATLFESADFCIFRSPQYWCEIGKAPRTCALKNGDEVQGGSLDTDLVGAVETAIREIAGTTVSMRDILRADGLDTYDGACSAHNARVDLSGRLTVFVTSVGASTYEACLTLLDNQDCRFRFRKIEYVAPMSAAFQQMLDTCETEYFVQVDEDMLLFPHAVRTLFEAVDKAGEQTAIYGQPLFDMHLARDISGVKIYRHAIVERYPYRDLEAFELDQIWRFKHDGYHYVMNSNGNAEEGSASNALGLHGTHLTPGSAYLRYFNQQRRQVYSPTEPWKNLLNDLTRMFHAAPTEINFHALAGAIAGRAHGETQQSNPGARDFRVYSETPGLAAATQLFEHLRRNEI